MDDLREPTDIGPVRIRQTHHDHDGHAEGYGIRIQPLPADVLPRIARALAAAGLLEEFAVLGRNRTADGLRGAVSLRILTSPHNAIDWDAVLGIDLTPEHATRLAVELERHAEEPPECDIRVECAGAWATVQVSPTRFCCVPCSQHVRETAVA